MFFLILRITGCTIAAISICACQTQTFSFGELGMLAPDFQGAPVAGEFQFVAENKQFVRVAPEAVVPHAFRS
ncbi:MAG: hypothetical protein Q8R92_01235 [Deltaproteobacteria bacterium]|nr:hypothetical protein [Deltaproteobacteria bacterium]